MLSQIAALLAFFLPLKVVILLGSEGFPRYFPQAWAAYDRDMLVASLCAATEVFYVLHWLADRIIQWGTDAGSLIGWQISSWRNCWIIREKLEEI